jgi:tRNA(Ile)-lysidine synthase
MTAARADVVAVAASGGRDSTALLHATVRAAKPLGLQVLALHVHHGLNPQADAWARHVQAQCARWRRAGWPVACEVARLEGHPAAGESVEAWARQARYEALTRMAAACGASLVLLAHHRRDQAETVLLQALRGAGPAGLAAMPAQAQRLGLSWARPWLGQTGESVQRYVAHHRLGHIEDDSNHDLRYDRNRLRHGLWPTLVEAFPHAEASLAQSARQSAQAAVAVQEWAAEDLAKVLSGQGALNVPAWLAFSQARRWQVLRAWLAGLAPEAPGSLVERLATELPRCKSGRWPLGAAREVRLYRGTLRVQVASENGRATPEPQACTLALSAPGVYALPSWQGRLQVRKVRAGGLPLALLAEAHCLPRSGGEQFQSHALGVPRSLKKQYQAAAIPAWQRGGPLVWSGGRLLWVPGLGGDARALAPAGVPQASLHWLPD